MDIRPQLQLQLTRYIDKKHSQAEVNGFIDGFEMACDLVDSCDGENGIESSEPHLPLGGVIRSFPDNVEIWKWWQTQKFQKEQGDQEYKMIYEIDLPKILKAFTEQFQNCV